MPRTVTIPQKSKSARLAGCVPNDNAGKRFHKEKRRDWDKRILSDYDDYAENKYWHRGVERDLAMRGWDTDYDTSFSDEELETSTERRARRQREREAFEELRRLFDDEPCTCIGPCLYPQGAKHPTTEQKRRFARALEDTLVVTTKPAKPAYVAKKRIVLPKHLRPTDGSMPRVRRRFADA